MSDSHRCIAGPECRRGERTDRRRAGALTEKPDTLCPGCHTRITSAIKQLPRDYAELSDALGDRTPNVGQRIRSTPTPAIPLSIRKESLRAAITEWADRAAAIVSDRLHTAEPAPNKGRGYPAHAERALRASVAIVGPNIDILTAAPAQPAMIWSKPIRCTTHRSAISLAEIMPNHTDRHTALREAYTAAGACEDCNGWGHWGQERQLTDISGIDIALQLAELHNQTRAELGLTHLRHKYELPCPNCGAQVGRDDGTTIVDCKQCESSWTEREYKFLVGLVLHERLDMEILKYLLAEAYSRLDSIQSRLDIANDTGDTLAQPGAGNILAESILEAIQGHKRPADRVITTDRESTTARQTDDDTWTWRNETPWQPPKPKPAKPHPTVKNPIAAASLTTITGINLDTITNGGAPCPDCWTIHAGQCA